MKATPEELAQTRTWIDATFGGIADSTTQPHAINLATTPPFSFVYEQRPSDALLATWPVERHSRALDSDRTEHTLTYTDPASGLEVRCSATTFRDFPAVEWVLHLRNGGDQDTPIIEDIQALDWSIAEPSGYTLHYARGGVCSYDDFAPLTRTLTRPGKVVLQAGAGRSSSEMLPFFNIETATGGVVAGIGWTGEWQAVVECTEDGRLHIRAGMERTHLILHPGEEIRSPRILLLFWQDDRWRGQNLLRQFILAHHRPTCDGEPMTMPICPMSWGATPAELHLDNIRQAVEHKLPFDYYWIDAAWYGQGEWWRDPGDWRVKQDLYPDGFESISDTVHATGRRFLLWFEPERVCPGTPWATEHAEWLLHVPDQDIRRNWGTDMADPIWVANESNRNQIVDGDALFDLGNLDARRFLTDFVSERITAWGIDCYRHDANIAPLQFWRSADAPDRQGMTEIRWVEGLYAFWDELLARHPGLIIDNCASGGRRIDLETIGRSTPLWRTDFPGPALAKQCHTLGLLAWVPLNATGGVHIGHDDNYAVRSSISSGLNVSLTRRVEERQPGSLPDDFPWDAARRTLEQYRDIQPYFLGDFYPLTQYSQATDAWVAYQLDRPEHGDGLVVVLKRPSSPYPVATFPLKGLNPHADYEITVLDQAEQHQVSGLELSVPGLNVSLANQPDSALITYRRL